MKYTNKIWISYIIYRYWYDNINVYSRPSKTTVWQYCHVYCCNSKLFFQIGGPVNCWIQIVATLSTRDTVATVEDLVCSVFIYLLHIKLMHFPITGTFLIYHIYVGNFFKEVTYAVIYITIYIYVHIKNITFYMNIHFTLHLLICT